MEAPLRDLLEVSKEKLNLDDIVKGAEESLKFIEYWNQFKSKDSVVIVVVESIQKQGIAYCSALDKSVKMADQGCVFSEEAIDLCIALLDPDTDKKELMEYILEMRSTAKRAVAAATGASEMFRDIRKMLFQANIPLEETTHSEDGDAYSETSTRVSSSAHLQRAAVDLQTLVHSVDMFADWWLSMDMALKVVQSKALSMAGANKIRVQGMKRHWEDISDQYGDYKLKVSRLRDKHQFEIKVDKPSMFHESGKDRQSELKNKTRRRKQEINLGQTVAELSDHIVEAKESLYRLQDAVNNASDAKKFTQEPFEKLRAELKDHWDNILHCLNAFCDFGADVELLKDAPESDREGRCQIFTEIAESAEMMKDGCNKLSGTSRQIQERFFKEQWWGDGHRTHKIISTEKAANKSLSAIQSKLDLIHKFWVSNERLAGFKADSGENDIFTQEEVTKIMKEWKELRKSIRDAMNTVKKATNAILKPPSTLWSAYIRKLGSFF